MLQDNPIDETGKKYVQGCVAKKWNACCATKELGEFS